jgi:uncharacterized protein YejL (UPF0352 family)
MPQNSRYDNNDIETMMNEILLVLEKRDANLDLSLMVLGNVISHILNSNVPAAQREQLAQTFSSILQKTLIQE